KIKARINAIVELVLVCFSMVFAMWVCLWWGGHEMNLDYMNWIGYGILGILLLWLFLFSWIFHPNLHGRYHYPTKNRGYACFEERGLGSLKHYYQHVFKKQKSLIIWTLYWFIVITSIFDFRDASLTFFDWKSIFEQSDTYIEPSGYIVDLGNQIGINADYTAVAVMLVVSSLSTIAFIFGMGKKRENFQGSRFWTIFFKSALGFTVFCCFFWFAKTYNIIKKVNILSIELAKAIGYIAGLFAIVAILLVFILMPIFVNFKNLSAPKNEILNILLTTIILLLLISVFFYWLLPRYGVGGKVLIWGPPFKPEPEYEVHNLIKNFDLGVFLVEWVGHYIIWGAVQQYLFMGYFSNLLRKIFPRSKGYAIAGFTGMIFGLIHAVDWPLMLFTAVAGMIWVWYWNKEYYNKKTGQVVRGNNLFLWGLVHGFGGSLLGMLAPFTMAVGPFNMYM
ncbi:MAG: hypothetical protein ACTSXP_16365, partial [Promethearchaeota archaeon]